MKTLPATLIGAVVALTVGPAHAQNQFYVLEASGAPAGSRVLSPTVAWTNGGCVDLSTSPPTPIDDVQYRPPRSGAVRHLTLEGEARLLAVEQLIDPDSAGAPRGLRISKIGCAPEEVVFEAAPGEGPAYRASEVLVSSGRPLLLHHPDGLALLALTPGSTPTPLRATDELHDDLMAQLGRVPFGLNNARTLQGVTLAGAAAQAVPDGGWLAVLSFGLQFEGLGRAVFYSWIVRVAVDGAVTLVLGPDEAGVTATDAPRFEMRTLPAWRVVWLNDRALSLDGLSAEQLRRGAFDRDPTLVANLPRQATLVHLDSEGALLVGTDYVRKVADAADLDGDGATAADEVTAGTSDGNPDHDGDGILDGTELSLGTDPLVADPLEPGRVAALGTTNLLREWAPISPVQIVAEERRVRTGPFSVFSYPFAAHFPFLCTFIQGAAIRGWNGDCYAQDGTREATVSLPSGGLDFLDDRLAYARTAPGNNPHGIVDWRTGEVLHPDVEDAGPLLGVSASGAAITRAAVSAPGALAYHDLATWQATPVRLGDDLGPYTLSSVGLLGTDPATGADFFAVVQSPLDARQTTQTWVYRWRDGQATRLFRQATLLRSAGVPAEQGTRLAALIPLEGGYLAKVNTTTRGATYITLDAKFRALRTWDSLPTMQLGARWDLGLLGDHGYTHTVGIQINGSPDASCISLNGVIACDAEPGTIARTLAEVEEQITQQLVTFERDALGPDDAVLGRFGLWRYTPDGVVAPWLSEADMGALGLVPQVDFIPGQNDIRSIAIARDRRAVCFVRGGRAFRLTLTPIGEIAALRIEPRQDVTACAWSMDGQLALATPDGVVVGGEPLVFDARGPVRTFFAASENRWLLLDEQFTAQCIGPEGRLGALADVNGLALFDENIVFVVSPQGRPHVLHLDDFCSDAAAMRRGDLFPSFLAGTLWQMLYFVANRSTNPGQTLQTTRAFIAPVAADHVLLLGLDVTGTVYPDTAPPVPFRLRPGYRVTGKLAAALGPSRFQVGTFSRAAERSFTAMAAAPNAALRETHSYYEEGELGAEPGPDAGPPGPEPEAEPSADGDGGCAAALPGGAPGPWPLALLLSAALLRSRRRR